MGIIHTFKEIAKKETVRRSKLPGLVRDMRNDIVEFRRTKMTVDSPAVGNDTSKSEFVGAYKNVGRMSLISSVYLIGIGIYLFTLTDAQSIIAMVCLFLVGVLWHISFCLRSLRARRVAEDWSNRDRPMKMSYSEFFDEVLGDPLTLLPFFKPLIFSSGKIAEGNQG